MAALPVQAAAYAMFAGLFGLSTYVISQFKKHPEKYRRGTVTRLNRAKGYGTIAPDDKRGEVRVYFHKDHPLAHDLQIGDRIGFQSHFGKRHRPRAINVVVFHPKLGHDGKETVKVTALPTREPRAGEESDLSQASSSANSERMSACSPTPAVALQQAGSRPRRHTLESSAEGKRRSASQSPRARHGPFAHQPLERRRSSQPSRPCRDSAMADYSGGPGRSWPSHRYSVSPEHYPVHSDKFSPPSDRHLLQAGRHSLVERYANRCC